MAGVLLCSRRGQEAMVARIIYSVIFYLLMPLVLLRLWWRGRLAPAYRDRVKERLGIGAPHLPGAIWVHAVSVGETLAAQPLINALMAACPERPLLVTTMTPTGSDRVRALWGNKVCHVYLPWDLPDAMGRFVGQVEPSLLIIMETELWPNLLSTCQRAKVPVMLANARLSERSARGYARWRSLTAVMLNQLDVIAAQDHATAERFRQLGVPAVKVIETGSLKFDIAVLPEIVEQARTVREAWNAQQRPVLVAGSTHRGEDELVLSAFAQVCQRFPGALLVLVPRHPERFDDVANLLRKGGWAFVRRSEQRSVSAATRVFLADSMGELLLWYALADVAYVGGSLVSVGGHNMLEPMALSVPTLCGPYLFNFQSIADELLAVGALKLVESADRLAELCCVLLSDEYVRKAQTEAALQVLAANRGALSRQLNLAIELLGHQN